MCLTLMSIYVHYSKPHHLGVIISNLVMKKWGPQEDKCAAQRHTVNYHRSNQL